MTTLPRSILVTCAAGAQGSAIVRAALAAGIGVRVLLRRSTTHPFGTNVDIVRGDLDEPDRLLLANLGIDVVALTLPNIADSATLVQYGRNAIDAAVQAGVKLVVMNAPGHASMPGDEATGVRLIDAKAEIERYLRTSGIPSIILRPTTYMGNLIAPWSAPAIVHNGVFAYPLPADFGSAWMAWEDLAAFVVEAMKRPELAGQEFDLGGPEILTGPQVAEILSGAIGRPVSYLPVPLADFAASLNAMLAEGAGDEIAAVYAWYARQPSSPLAIDPAPALAAFPIKPTSFSHWARTQDWAAHAANAKAA